MYNLIKYKYITQLKKIYVFFNIFLSFFNDASPPCKIIHRISWISYDLRNCSSRCSMDKILNRLETRRRDATRAKLSKEVGHNREEKKAPERKREGRGEEAGVAAKRKRKKKKKIVGWRRLASGSRHILLFAFPLRPSTTPSFFLPLLLLLLLRVSASSRFRPKFAFLAFRHEQTSYRNISLSSRLWNLAIIRNDLRIWLKKKENHDGFMIAMY